MDSQYTYQPLLAPQQPRDQGGLLVASLLHLMSHYSVRQPQDEPCLKLAAVIERHLAALARLPGIDPMLRASCEQLTETWGDLVDARLPAPTRQNILARFMGLNGKRNTRNLTTAIG